MNRLKKCVDKDNLDINQLFMENTKEENKCLNFSTFAQFILKIDPSCNNEEIKCLFNLFDPNSDGKIIQSELQKGICKMAEIVPLEKEEIDEISSMKEENSFEKKKMNEEM
jgi:Ca2+-binding EF-hand superfamily protein